MTRQSHSKPERVYRGYVDNGDKMGDKGGLKIVKIFLVNFRKGIDKLKRLRYNLSKIREKLIK